MAGGIHAASDATRAEGWDHECAAGGHVASAAYEAGNQNYGDAAIHVAEAVAETFEAQASYTEANNEMIAASQDHIQTNYESGGGGCNIL